MKIQKGKLQKAVAVNLFCCLVLDGFIERAAADNITASISTNAHVYECVANGQRVFSDQVCGDDAQQREIAPSNRMVATDTRNLHTALRTQKKRASSNNDALESRKQRCAKLRSNKESLTERMRAGFSARQDEKLHERLRKVDNDYYELRCSGLH